MVGRSNLSSIFFSVFIKMEWQPCYRLSQKPHTGINGCDLHCTFFIDPLTAVCDTKNEYTTRIANVIRHIR